MSNGLLLWVDDEIELLRAHILFLEKKGYQVETATNGADAIERCRQTVFDLILLDEMMPGLSGLETLRRVKETQPATPVVMCTKSEEEHIMDLAIGSKIADYLIKPVNPHQILLTLKKNIHRHEIVTEVTQTGYRQAYMDMADQVARCRTWQDWMEVYRRLVYWELELSGAQSPMASLLEAQKEEANKGFAKYVASHYLGWVSSPPSEPRPLMSPDIFKSRVFPALDRGEKVFLIVVDNFRYDQWRTLLPALADSFQVEEELYVSILPTATQYARNAIFSGLMPSEIASLYPHLWVDEDEEEGKNLNEEPLIKTQMDRHRRPEAFRYHKVNDSAGAEKLLERFGEWSRYPLNVVVINFIDMLSHARTESRMVRELARDESAYRGVTLGWLRHSAIAGLFRRLAQEPCHVILTTDHGSIRCRKPVKIVGDRATNTNLRYKLGKNLGYSSRDLFVIKRPQEAHLPAPHLSTSYVFATGSDFFAYPNNYNHYASYYRDTFQHGGVSMEEMLIPLVSLKPRKR